MSLDLSWQRVRWEALTNPFEVADPFFHLNLRRFELTDEPPALDFRPGDGLDLTLVRGARIRRQVALELKDYLVLVEAVTRCHAALLELLQPVTDNFRLNPDPHAVEWLLPGRAGPTGRWWLAVDVSNCFESMDYRRLALALPGLDKPWRRAVLALLARHASGPRQGVVSCGRVNHVFTRLYLQPVVAALKGYTFSLTGLDDFHLFVDSRREGLRALEFLAARLAEVGLQVNYARTWLVESARARREQALARLRWENVKHRLASWGARAGLPVASWFGLENALFIHRRPSFLELLQFPAVQEAFYRRLQHDDLYFGDRALLLLCLAWAPARPQGRLVRYLQTKEGPLYRAAREGMKKGRPCAGAPQ